jgi:dihydrofolate reductase
MSDLQEEVQRQSAASDTFLTGRRTFEDLRSYWPHRGDDTTGTSAYLDGVSKYVVSSTLTEPGWENTTILAGDPVETVGALKDGEGADIVVTGSITLCHTLLAAGLADEIRLFTYPVVQGRGRRLFPLGFGADRLRLLDARAFRSGIVLTTYAIG